MSTRLDQDDHRRKAERQRKAQEMTAQAGRDAVVVGLVSVIGAAFGVAVLIFALVTCSNSIFEPTDHAGSSAVSACVRRGVAYFSEIGSYPSLSDGRDALTVATERCNRTTTAF